MNRRNLLIFAGFWLNLWACQMTESQPLAEAPPPVVLILNEPPANGPFRLPGLTPWMPRQQYFTLLYYDQKGQPQWVESASEAGVDTVVIWPDQEWLEVSHDYHSIDEWSYLFRAGDTVHFSYEGETPVAEIANRTCLPFDVN